MAAINSTRQFHSEVSIVCSAFEALQWWVENQSEKVGTAQFPLIARLRDLLDQADGLVGPDER